MGSWKHHQFQRVLVSRSIFHVSWVCSLTSKNLSFFIGKIGMKNHFLTVAMRINRALYFFCSLVFILDLNFKNVKYTRGGQGLTLYQQLVSV